TCSSASTPAICWSRRRTAKCSSDSSRARGWAGHWSGCPRHASSSRHRSARRHSRSRCWSTGHANGFRRNRCPIGSAGCRRAWNDMCDRTVEVRGESLALLPERAVYWERARTLVVADAHFGKAATFRAHGLPLPHGTTAETLLRLDSALARTGAGRILFIGDLLLARAGRAPRTLVALGQWRFRHAHVEMTLVRG